jgi:hypothetical protein
MNPADKNRRSAIRKRPKGWLRVECRRQGTFGPSISDVVWDVSETGLCLVTNTEVKPGQELEVHITSSSLTQALKLTGKIIWVDALDNNQFSVGVRFDKNLPYHQVSMLTL